VRSNSSRPRTSRAQPTVLVRGRVVPRNVRIRAPGDACDHTADTLTCRHRHRPRDNAREIAVSPRAQGSGPRAQGEDARFIGDSRPCCLSPSSPLDRRCPKRAVDYSG
jgi:hypothetical protein